MSILALDVGKKKIGVAISKSGLISSEYCTIHIKDPKTVTTEIIFLIKKENISKIIIGLPKNNNQQSEILKIVNDFADDLKNKLKNYKIDAEIYFEDESLTSKEAERLLFQEGLQREKITERRDQMSAKLILDQYLDHQ